LLEALGTFAGDAIFLPLLLGLLMPCRGEPRLAFGGIRGGYYESLLAARKTRGRTRVRMG